MKYYIKESNKKCLKEWKEWYLFKKIPFIIIKPFQSNIHIPNIISYVEKFLGNRKCVSFLEGIYIGEFPQLIQRNIQAMFNDGVIYVSNNQNSSEERIAKDIIHEIGHSLERAYGLEIYGDSNLRNEFIGKRQRLYDILSYNGVTLNRREFLSTIEYSSQIDDFLYKEIGYARLTPLIQGLFLNPYCVTSISEYFSNGFEEFLTGDKKYLQQICPLLYNKIIMLREMVYES